MTRDVEHSQKGNAKYRSPHVDRVRLFLPEQPLKSLRGGETPSTNWASASPFF